MDFDENFFFVLTTESSFCGNSILYSEELIQSRESFLGILRFILNNSIRSNLVEMTIGDNPPLNKKITTVTFGWSLEYIYKHREEHYFTFISFLDTYWLVSSSLPCKLLFSLYLNDLKMTHSLYQVTEVYFRENWGFCWDKFIVIMCYFDRVSSLNGF